MDIQAASKLIPVRPDQWQLLGFQWEDQFYFQVALSFGSRSSPRLFNYFADCLEALFQQRAGDAAVRKYLDGFWLVAPLTRGTLTGRIGRCTTCVKQSGSLWRLGNVWRRQRP